MTRSERPHTRRTAALAPAALAVAALASGCSAQRGLERAAMDASDQIAALEIEVQDKVEAETEFYDRNLAAMKQAIADSRSLRLRRRIQADAASFAAAKAGQPVTNADLVQLAQGSMSQWQQTEAALDQALSQSEASMTANRKDLQSDLSKLDGLQSQLRTLGRSRTRKELAAFVYGFAGASADDFLQLTSEQGGDGGDGAADDGGGGSPGGDGGASGAP